jgi:glutathione peroxidase
MRSSTALFGLAAATAMTAFAAGTIHDFTLKTIDGQDMPLAAYKGKVVLIVNTASQ